ncbi:MAG: hypothetical protein C0399_11550 [Syntrophus sp. (in: bacteria)]|nr:hypothetical protein [Syntrophus sp. (in: bacteria)]MBA4418950.1 hypothetical protein [Syntrophus sp. (in: bacteria)]
MIQPFVINSLYNIISGLMIIPDTAKGPYPCVILSHGLISSKESSKYVALSEQFAAEGIASCRFDYHGCGESSGNIEETTLTIRLENLDAIVDYARNHVDIDPDRIGILGSSFGGVTCLLKASRDKRIQCVSPWATPYELNKTDDGNISDIKFKDTIYSDFLQYDVLAESAKVSHALVIHGADDDTVPCHEGKTIYERLQNPKRLEIIKGADHTFSNSVHRDEVISMGLTWFKKYLLKG